MNSNDKDELDNELIKSMKKLVEEETNVAKAVSYTHLRAHET